MSATLNIGRSAAGRQVAVDKVHRPGRVWPSELHAGRRAACLDPGLGRLVAKLQIRLAMEPLRFLLNDQLVTTPQHVDAR